MKLSKRTEYKLDFIVGGKVDNSLAKSVSGVNNRLDSITGTAKRVAATAATLFASIKVKDIFDESIQASKEFETSMAGVAKVVDGLKDDNGKVTSQYDDMKKAIIGMSKELPMTAESIATIMEAAGQSNIAKKELLEFSETATKMGIAFDSTADQAGEWMAAWRTALDLNQQEVTTLADKINYLGNTSSESAIKLSEVVTTVGSLAKTSGISADTVAAIAASMTKVDSNVAATGIKNFALALVMGESATKKQAGAFKQLGLDSKKVAKNMQINSQGTIVDVLERISKLDKQDQSSLMKNLFGKESLSSIAPLVSNLDNLKEQFNKVGDAALYAGSMEQEYFSASSTSANVDVLKDNKIKAMQIQIGDVLVPLSVLTSEAIAYIAESVGNFVENNVPALERGVRNTIKAFKEFAPTAVYSLKSIANGVGKLKPLGQWILDHPDIIVNSIITIGVALKTYKIANNFLEIAAGAKMAGGPLKYLSTIITHPWGLAIAGVAGGIALIASSVASSNRELKKADLESRFGNISLSMKDLDSVAKEILKNKNFEKLSEAINIRDGLAELEDSIASSIAELSKMNWKVSIGMKLTEEEKLLYKSSITSFLSETQKLLEEDQYSLKLALEILTDEGEDGQATRDSFNNFYLKNQAELKNLGKQLKEVVNEAFTDGILSIDEAKEIARLQEQIASITRKLAKSKLEATLEVSQHKLTGGELTPDSFKNLMAEMNEQSKETVADYDEALTTVIARSKLMLDEGEITKSQHNANVEEAKKNYDADIGELQLTISRFGLDTIYEAYQDELDTVLPEFEKYAKESLESRIEDFDASGDWSVFEETVKIDFSKFKGLSKGAKLALKDLVPDLKPSLAEMEKQRDSFIEEGKQIPESLRQGITEANMLLALTGDTEAILTLAGTTIAESPEHAVMVENARNTGIALNDGIIEGLESKQYELEQQSRSVVQTISNSINDEIAKGKIDSSIAALKNKISNPQINLNPKNFSNNLNVQGFASGGIIMSPTLATFAEEGPEAAIPLDGSKNAIDLWYMAGQILGMFSGRNTVEPVTNEFNQLASSAGSIAVSNGVGAPIKVEYNINVESGADVGKIQQAISMSQSQFDHLMKTYERNNKRVNM